MVINLVRLLLGLVVLIITITMLKVPLIGAGLSLMLSWVIGYAILDIYYEITEID